MRDSRKRLVHTLMPMIVVFIPFALHAEGKRHAPPPPLGLAPIPADGLVVYKLHRQDDEFAPCVEYANIKFFRTVANMTTMGGRFLSVQRGQVAYHIDYPSPNAELLTDHDFDQLKQRIREYQSVSRRFKYTAPLLNPWITKLRQEIDLWEQGYGRAEGRWVQRAKYTYERDVTRLRENLALRKSQILGKPGPVDKDPDEPLWAVDLETQLKASIASAGEQRRKQREAERRARVEEFHRTTENKLTRKSASRPSGYGLDQSAGLDRAGELDKSGGLDKSGPLTSP